ncbi:hypothetical protein SM11_pC0780 (plasmid) [Sinorhizobium meliloti SM11]|uniref:Uncharacterized protein n=1 Tax=Sinorhizobium meliloti (strain SM11) TaxID=707241 RepID=F7XE78_SINMM|nr:hypothetical protein SM11_pC0780 [Sinorhizobium meliloti SM11]
MLRQPLLYRTAAADLGSKLLLRHADPAILARAAASITGAELRRRHVFMASLGLL